MIIIKIGVDITGLSRWGTTADVSRQEALALCRAAAERDRDTAIAVLAALDAGEARVYRYVGNAGARREMVD